MAAKNNAKNKPKPSKTNPNPRRVSGISAAAIRGAKEGEAESDNAAKMARPGPGMTDPRTSRTRSGSMESAAAESAAASVPRMSEEDADAWGESENASPDDFDDFAGPAQP